METWIWYAILSMIFAGLTSILAKYGLEKVNADLGLAIRVIFIFVFIIGFTLVNQTIKNIGNVSRKEWLFLGLSALATTLSWVFYYRAMKDGLVSYVAAIDKASILITLILSFILLREPVTPKILVGGGLIFAGMLVLVWK
jgi:transporter family protein